jgi:SEC-C motif
MRLEQTLFNDLAALCSSPGYVHTIAYLCFRDNMVRYAGDIQPEDIQHLFSKTRLIRTEISTLQGLLIKSKIDYSTPDPQVTDNYIKQTESLLEEIHQSFFESFFAKLNPNDVADQGFNPFTSGAVLREPIFYGAESAYNFQYRDLSPPKYTRDNDWMIANRGFSIQEARDVVNAVGRLLADKTTATLNAMRNVPPREWTLLPAYRFTGCELAVYAHMEDSLVKQVLDSFAVPAKERNKEFKSLSDFNVANALPLIKAGNDSYILFSVYSLAEALYESPFYWMAADKTYASTAMQHRGLFTEKYATGRLVRVFGEANVHPNVDVFDSNDKKIGEIDVLVLFGNRAIVLQAKSKRLTLESRKGNDKQIRDDFKKSIQDSCDQAYKCAEAIVDGTYMLKDSHSKRVAVPAYLKDIYVLCVVSDHYPALSFQARQFLKFKAHNPISPPFVLDVFTLDAMTEMLESPLQLLSYVDRRTRYFDKLLASHESMILSYHLKQNLWLAGDNDLVVLEDDLSADLDAAMLVRREGLPGKKTPEGILTRFEATSIGRLVSEIQARPDPAIIDLGFMILTLSEKAMLELSSGIDELVKRARADGMSHDLTMGFDESNAGFTLHCNDDFLGIAELALREHCHKRKYIHRAHNWFGICIRPSDAALRFALHFDNKWEHSKEMDVKTRQLTAPGRFPRSRTMLLAKNEQVGRNDLCPCGSRKKYKKCCLPK